MYIRPNLRPFHLYSYSGRIQVQLKLCQAHYKMSEEEYKQVGEKQNCITSIIFQSFQAFFVQICNFHRAVFEDVLDLAPDWEMAFEGDCGELLVS